MTDIETDKLNAEFIISLYAEYNVFTNLYNDRSNWGAPACNRCRFASGCAYFKHEPDNNSSCFRFKWDGYTTIQLILKKESNNNASERRYFCLKEGKIL